MYFGTDYKDTVLVVTIGGHLGAILGKPLRRRPENGEISLKSAPNVFLEPQNGLKWLLMAANGHHQSTPILCFHSQSQCV